MKPPLFEALVVHHISSMLPMKNFHHFPGATNENIDISVGRIESDLTNLPAQTIDPHSHIRRMLRHYYPIVFIQIKHGVFDYKGRNQKHHKKVGLLRMVTQKARMASQRHEYTRLRARLPQITRLPSNLPLCRRQIGGEAVNSWISCRGRRLRGAR